MNKTDFINELQKRTNFNKEHCTIINDVLENNFIFGKKNKGMIIEELKIKLNIDETSADEIYNISMNIINSTVKNKIIHPFRSKD